jgi:protein-glutamine gamma-glutamyltransferase
LILARRQQLRLRFRDFAALSAFVAIAITGVMPLWVSFTFVSAFALSVFGKRPLSGKRISSVVVLLAIAAVLFALTLRGTIDLIVAAVSFAALVTAHRLLAEPDAAASHQVLLASLLLISGGAALSGEIWYALCLFFFGVNACLSLGLMAVEGPVEQNETIPMGPVFRQISWGVCWALVGGIAFFFVFPRLSWNVAARRVTPGLLGGTTGLSDRVSLDGSGNLKTSVRVVVRVAIDPLPKTEKLEAYWPGRRFTLFDGKEWRSDGTANAPAIMISFPSTARKQTTQRVELLPAYDAKTLIALEHVVRFQNATGLSAGGPQPSGFQDVPGEEVRLSTDATAYAYTAISAVDKLPELEGDLERNLALPKDFDPRIAALAQQVVRDDTDALQRARHLERFLKSTFSYSLDLGEPVDEPLAEFLFVRKQGHCEHFATALASMLRTLGIPSRVVGGFFGGEKIGDRYALRAGDAHAWVEALIDHEWVRLDATPESFRSGSPSALIARVVALWERLEDLWRRSVIDYSLVDQADFVRSLIRPPKGVEPAEPATSASTFQLSPRILLGTSLLLGALWGLARRVKRWRPAHRAVIFHDEVMRRLSGHQLNQSALPLEELAKLLQGQQEPCGPVVQQATDKYLAARFARMPFSTREQQEILLTLDQMLLRR